MSLPVTFAEQLQQASRPLAGMWCCAASPVVAEICAGSGIDWLLLDGEHGPNVLSSLLGQLQAAAAYPVPVVVRVPANDPIIIKQVLDLGAQNLLVPMVNSAAEATAAVAATRYPPAGIRGVGSALARSSRWNRVDDYLTTASDLVSLTVQIESVEAVAAAREIAAVEGVSAVFVGPSDLAASMGLLGQQTHPDVVAAIHTVFDAVRSEGKFVGVNAFDPAQAASYAQHGAAFVSVGADVTLLARGAEALAQQFVTATDRQTTQTPSVPRTAGY